MAFIDTASFVLERAVSIIVVLLIGLILAKLVSRLIRRFWAEAELNKVLKKAGLKPVSLIFSRWAEYIIYIITFFIILNILGLTNIFIIVLLIMLAIGVGLPLLFALKDFVPNFIIGLFIKKKLKSNLNKKVKIGIVKGTLTDLGAASCTVMDKQPHVVPYTYVRKNY